MEFNKILVVDDEPLVLATIKRILARLDAELLFAGSVKEALAALELGKAGVFAFVEKPFTAEDLLEVIDGLQAPNLFELDAVGRRVGGQWAMPDVLDAVRRSMVFEALARAHGNKAQAAQLLGISRQNLQNILSRGKV